MFKFVLLLAAVALAAQQAAAQTPSGPFSIEVDLNGKLNKVKTKASGKIKAIVNPQAQTIRGTLTLKNIKGVNAVHLHVGAADVNNGPVIAFLWPLDTKLMTTQPFDAKDWTVPFTLQLADFPFPRFGGRSSTPLLSNFAGLVQAIINGEIYANVHTVKNQAGEIRGQTYVDPNVLL